MQMDSITREREREREGEGVKLKSGRGQKLMESFRVKSKTKNFRPSILLLLSYHKQKTEIKFGEQSRSFLSNQPIRFLVKRSLVLGKKDKERVFISARRCLKKTDWVLRSSFFLSFSLAKLSLQKVGH